MKPQLVVLTVVLGAQLHIPSSGHYSPHSHDGDSPDVSPGQAADGKAGKHVPRCPDDPEGKVNLYPISPQDLVGQDLEDKNLKNG